MKSIAELIRVSFRLASVPFYIFFSQIIDTLNVFEGVVGRFEKNYS